MKLLELFVIMIFTCCIFTNAWSEIYQWKDENDQTHFGDRAPNSSAKNISHHVDQINITSDLSSPEMMLRQEQAKDAERKKQYEEWQEKTEKQPSKAEKCEELNRLLNTIKGRVIFVDEHGKDLKISESERKHRVTQLEDGIRKHCQ